MVFAENCIVYTVTNPIMYAILRINAIYVYKNY